VTTIQEQGPNALATK